MQKRKSFIFKRLLCIVLCLAMVIPAIYIPVLADTAQTGSGSSTGTVPHVSDESYSVGGVTYNINRSTRYLGNRTYEIQMTLDSSISLKDYAVNRDFSKNGYFTVQKNGWYLLELWGGNGSEGQDCIQLSFAHTPGLYPGGDGGTGGYVYAKVYIKAGQTLVYSIGTNGTQSESFDDAGGGANGDGGTHGESGSYKVGGGGGYSAFYLLEEEDNFDPAWVTETEVNLPETVRLSRYIMIAGGGGGGGAGCGSIVINGDISEPDGGDAGRCTSSAITLGEGYDVPGYVYAGWDGASSGTSTAYVGQGGAVIPGECCSTWLNVTDSSKMPNDWSGLANPDAEPGAGGSGNFRGGAGGAGFAGGSGGIMASAISAAHVGGGGGGSSFIAASINDRAVVRSLDSEASYFLRGFSNKPANAIDGGAAHITYLGDESDIDTSTLIKNVTLTTQISKYFDVVTAVSIVKEGSASNTLASLDDGSNLMTVSGADSNGYVTVTASGLSIRPESIYAGQTSIVRLRVRAKAGMLGGNDVEMIRHTVDGVVMKFQRPDDLAWDQLKSKPENNYTHNYVNVPLDAKMVTHSYTSSNITKSYLVSSLYEDSYSGVRSSVNRGTNTSLNYAFIANISTYTVKNPNGTVLSSSSSVTPTATTKYTVSYVVTVKAEATAACTVGPAIPKESTITGTAVISIVLPDTSVLNGLTVSGYKTLGFEDGAYKLGVGVEQLSDDFVSVGSKTTFTLADDQEYEWSPPTAGWYYIQAWGGNGQGSGASHVNRSSLKEHGLGARSAGGVGGYVSGFVYLTTDDIITYKVGVNSTTPTTAMNNQSTSISCRGNNCSWTNGVTGATADAYIDIYGSVASEGWVYTAGGKGGTYTSIELNDKYLFIAGGGGGAGGSGAAATTGSKVDGESGETGGTNKDPTIAEDRQADLNAYNGEDGNDGFAEAEYNFLGGSANANPYEGNGDRGEAGANFTYIETVTGYDEADATNKPSKTAQLYSESLSTSRPNGKNGQITITLLESKDSSDALNALYDLSANGTISRYFDVESIEMEQASVKATSSVETTNDDGSKTVIYKNSNGEEISRFTYKLSQTTLSDGTPVTEWVVGDTQYIPKTVKSSSVKQDASDDLMCHQSSLTFTLKLKPKEGFLGGNDVPLVAYDENDPTLNDTSEGDPYYGVCIGQRGQTMNLRPKEPTDFANVAMNYDLLEIFETQDTTIRLGDSVENTSLYTFVPPTYEGEDAWKAEFVEFIAPATETYQPDKTTTYDLTATLKPKTEAESAIATIESALDPLTCTLPATVYVELPVTYNLTNLSPSGTQWVLYGTPIDETLYPDAGYNLPTDVSVTYTNSGNAVAYQFEGGLLSVEGSLVTEPITVTASATVKTYNVYLQYVSEKEYDSNTPMTTETFAGIAAGSSLAEVWARANAITAGMPLYEGYQFAFQSDVDDPSTNEIEYRETMPAHDLYIVGTYEKLLYGLTIHYVKTNGEKAADDYNGYVYYGDSYAITSPIVEGYRADQLVVSGTQGSTQNEITVTYTQSQNELVILYVKADGTQAAEPYFATVEVGTVYSVPSPNITGYLPDIETVTGEMVENGVTVKVTYTPKTYELNLIYAYEKGDYPDAPLNGVDLSGATMNADLPRKVEFDKAYTYNPDTQSYEGLPTPKLAGYVFVGWYTDDEWTQALDEGNTVVGVAEDTLVENGGTITLYAKWKPQSFRLVVEFVLNYTEGDFLPDGAQTVLDNAYYSAEHEFGSAVSITIPQIEGYTPYLYYLTSDQDAIEVDPYALTMPGQNRKIIVTYAINTYTVSFVDATNASNVKNAYVEYSDGDTSSEFDAFSAKTWETVTGVRYNEIPTYTKATPTHSTTERYTYTFVRWSGEDENGVLPVVRANVTYYACYDATENVVGVTCGSSTKYYTDVTQAIAAAEEYLNQTGSACTLKFRRNAGNVQEIDLDQYGRLIFGNIYTGTANRTVYIDLNGLTLYTSNSVAVDCTNNGYFTLNFVKGATSAAGGTIRVSGTGDVTAIDFKSRTLEFDSAITVEAISANGNATAINYDVTYSGYYLYLTQNITVSAQADHGTAVAIALPKTTTYVPVVSGSSSYKNATLSACGKTAYGIYAPNGYTLTNWYGDVNAEGVGGTDAFACGIYGVSTEILKNDFEITVNSTGEGYGVILPATQRIDGVVIAVNANEAVGIQVQNGTTLQIGSSAFEMDVTGTQRAVGMELQSGATFTNSIKNSKVITVLSGGDAYGVWNEGTIASIGLSLKVDAAKNAYGLYNNGGSVTGGTSGVRNNFTVDANVSGTDPSIKGYGYGIYSIGGSVGSLDAYVSQGVIAGSDYGIYCEDGSIYVSGFDLYFKGKDGDRNAALVGATIYPEHYVAEAVDAAHAGYYRLATDVTITFVDPSDEGEEKDVILTTITLPNAAVVTAPDDPTKCGYTFDGWYSNRTATTATTVPTSMPGEDLILYAGWEIVVYKYALDAGAPPADTPAREPITVIFHKNYPETNPKDSAAQNITVTYSGDSSVFAEVRDLTYVPNSSNNPLCIHRGWYKNSSITSANYVPLDDSDAIYALDTDDDKIVHLYAGWKQLWARKNHAAFDTNRDTAITISGDRGYLYYAVPYAGDYKITLQMKSGQGQLGGLIYNYSSNAGAVCKEGSNDPLEWEGKSNSVSSTTTQVYTAYGCQPGDIISFIWRPTTSGTFNLYISDLPDGAPSGSGGAPIEILTYTVEDGENGVVTLPISTANDDPSKRFAGWQI
ncbi:MAG: InlB B-repeat-containing protein, partial [Clostridia bacterium]|nr:InlB B-repeat-containing protein [Clostridia bacterium]